MNYPELFDYGIQVENSDIRAHVSPKNKIVYVFETRRGKEAIEKYSPPMRKAFQPGVDFPTADGWLVKPEWIEDIRVLKFQSWPRWVEYNDDWTTTQKGNFAVDCVLSILKIGRFPIWINAEEDDREKIQLKGTDIVLYANKRIQVKCDSPAAITGNLYLQKAERNPHKRH